jgi:hypothetical protein
MRGVTRSSRWSVGCRAGFPGGHRRGGEAVQGNQQVGATTGTGRELSIGSRVELPRIVMLRIR